MNSRTGEQRDTGTRKQTGCTGTGLGTVGDGDGPCVFAAARHQRGLKLKLNLHNMAEIFPSH